MTLSKFNAIWKLTSPIFVSSILLWLWSRLINLELIFAFILSCEWMERNLKVTSPLYALNFVFKRLIRVKNFCDEYQYSNSKTVYEVKLMWFFQNKILNWTKKNSQRTPFWIRWRQRLRLKFEIQLFKGVQDFTYSSLVLSSFAVIGYSP